VASNLYGAESSLARRTWGCFSMEVFGNYFALARASSSDCDTELERNLFQCAAYAVFAGTRGESAAADETVSAATTYAYAYGALPADSQIILNSHFCSETSKLIGGEFSWAESVSEFGPLPSLDSVSLPPVPHMLERLRVREDWKSAVRHELELLSTTETDLDRWVSDIGPRYNELDSDGIPIPGALVAAPNSGGLGSVEGITRTGNGIAVIGRQASGNEKPLIFDSDVRVALILAFLEKTPIEPHFSLDSFLDKKEGDEISSILQERVFNPEWLGSTDFGRTLAYSDYLLQQVIGASDICLQSVTTYASAISRGGRAGPDKQSPAFRYLNKMRAADVPDPAGVEGGRFCIKLRELSVRILDRDDTIALSGGGGYIESSYYFPGADGALNSSYRRDDETTANGKRSANFSKSWGVLCGVFPVFARVESLLVLFKLFKFARERGWKLPDATMKLLREERLKLSVPPKSYVPFPYHQSGCRCHGRWPSY
jgi:hypothetical protein